MRASVKWSQWPEARAAALYAARHVHADHAAPLLLQARAAGIQRRRVPVRTKAQVHEIKAKGAGVIKSGIRLAAQRAEEALQLGLVGRCGRS